MIDYFLKRAKMKKVNFCYAPGLTSNGRYLKNGKILVFTYVMGKTFKLKKMFIKMQMRISFQNYMHKNYKSLILLRFKTYLLFA